MDKLLSVPAAQKQIQVSVGVIKNADGQLLVAKRPSHLLGGGCWEFPGGKIEPNEDSHAALLRELLEEVGLVVTSCRPFMHVTYDYPERKVLLNAWMVDSYTGTAAGLEGQEIAWCLPYELNNLNMLPANRALVVAIQLPDIYAIVNPDIAIEEFLLRLEQKLQHTPIGLLQLNQGTLTKQEYKDMLVDVSHLCRKYHVQLLAVNDLSLTEVADGVVLSPQQLRNPVQRSVAKDKWLVAICHDDEHLRRAQEMGADFAILAAGTSNPQELQKLTYHANIPLFIRDDLPITDLARAKMLGAQGLALFYL